MPTRFHERVLAALILGLFFVIPTPLSAQADRSAILPLVVIDAGHGGVDPGARGTGGTREKDVTLRVAKALAALLEREGRYDVRLTRSTDTLIALRDRSRFANRWRGEGGQPDRPAVFISIHANAHRDRGTRGFETYFLSDAKTADAERVAEMENAAQEFEEPAAFPADDLSFILTDLRQNRYVHESSSWAEMIQRRLRAVHPGPNRGVKQAGFVVLDGAFMPAVLVELAFISNTGEEKLLADGRVQQEFATRLAGAVHDYFEHHEAISGTLTR